jgi:phosphatidate cytidylyltransferase
MDIIFQYNSQLALAGIFALLSAIMLIGMISKKRIFCSKYLKYTWAFLLILLVSKLFSFSYAAIGWAIMSFLTLREYFSLTDLRIQDRVGILVAYLSIPFMIYLITIDWYNMFIISIPVYSFLVIPFLISISGKDFDGAIYSIGTIDFGLFLFVFCLGHLAYLSYLSCWMAVMLILSVAICDVIPIVLGKKITSAKNSYLFRLLMPMPLTVGLSLLMLNWTNIPMVHSIILGLMIPALVVIGYHTVRYFELDLGIVKEEMKTGEGQIIDNVKTLLYTSPIVFHYIRYFLF